MNLWKNVQQVKEPCCADAASLQLVDGRSGGSSDVFGEGGGEG